MRVNFLHIFLYLFLTFSNTWAFNAAIPILGQKLQGAVNNEKTNINVMDSTKAFAKVFSISKSADDTQSLLNEKRGYNMLTGSAMDYNQANTQREAIAVQPYLRFYPLHLTHDEYHKLEHQEDKKFDPNHNAWSYHWVHAYYGKRDPKTNILDASSAIGCAVGKYKLKTQRVKKCDPKVHMACRKRKYIYVSEPIQGWQPNVQEFAQGLKELKYLALVEAQKATGQTNIYTSSLENSIDNERMQNFNRFSELINKEAGDKKFKSEEMLRFNEITKTDVDKKIYQLVGTGRYAKLRKQLGDMKKSNIELILKEKESISVIFLNKIREDRFSMTFFKVYNPKKLNDDKSSVTNMEE